MVHKKIIFLFSLLISICICGQQKQNFQKDKFDILFYDAVNARTVQDYASSFDLLKYCYAMDSTNTAVAYELGNFYKTLNQPEKALSLYKKATEGLPNNYYYGVTYAAMALQSGRFADAITAFSALIDEHPTYNSLYFYLAEAYKQNKNYQEAINTLTKAEEYVGLNEQVSITKYDLYKILGEEEKAFAEIQKYIDKYPEQTEYYILMGDLYMQDDKADKAKPFYEKAKSLDPTNPYIVVSLANYYNKIGQKEFADQELRQAIQSASMDIDTKMQILAQYMSDLHSQEDDTQKINTLLDTLLVMHPQEPKLNMLYGNVLMIQGDKAKARDQFKIFAEANPSNPAGWEQLVNTAFPDSLDYVINVCEEAIKNLPESPQFYYYEGVAQFLKKDYEKSIKAFDTGKQYIPEKNTQLLSDFYGQIGDIYHQLGKMDSTYVYYDQALKYNPNNIMVLNNYSYFLSLDNKDLSKAERMSSTTIKSDPLNPTYLDTYAWVLFKQGDYSLARMYIEKAFDNSKKTPKDASKNPEDASGSSQEDVISSEMYDHYGDILFKLGEKDKAMEYWQKAKDVIVDGEDSTIIDKKLKTGEYYTK